MKQLTHRLNPSRAKHALSRCSWHPAHFFTPGFLQRTSSTLPSTPREENALGTQVRKLPKLRLSRQSSGFTIVELMIASTVFAAVLLLITYAVLQIGRTYYKGITSARTQETARAVMDEISQAVQFGSGTPNVGGGMVCAGGKRFSYTLNQQVSDSPVRHALRMQDVDSCEGQSADMSQGRELLSTRMRLSALSVQPVGSGDLYRIRVRVVSGDNELLEDALNASGNPGTDGVLDTCRAQRSGTQFCAASELSTVVQKRAR